MTSVPNPLASKYTSPSHYRPDIDGLRAIAVLAVIFFHFGVPWISGGFVGVDIFFVISGYLIGGQISHEIHAGRFSILSFWERRIRRIYPAFVFVICATFVFALLYMLPAEFKTFSASMVATAASASNVWFNWHSGYFADLATKQPLLHTWSLAVEEQYYVFLPVFLSVLLRFWPLQEARALAFVAAVSFLWAAIGAFLAPEPTFYLLPSRIWELLLGTILAVSRFGGLSIGARSRLLGLVGIALMLGSIFLLSKNIPFPGIAAAPPCLGAALAIYAGSDRQSFTYKALSLRPLVFVGLLSYSLYLWHWPVLILSERYIPLTALIPERFLLGPLLTVTFLLAWCSWRFIEIPFRVPGRFSRRFLFSSFLGCSLALVIAGVLTIGAQGYPSRYSPGILSLSSFLDYQSSGFTREGRCFLTSRTRYEDFDFTGCLHNDRARPNYLVVGDSHAAHYWYGFAKEFPNINFMEAAASGCRPTIDQPISADASCAKLFRYIYGSYLSHGKIDGLIVAGRWEESDVARVKSLLVWTKRRGINVLLIGPIVEYRIPLPRLLAWSIEMQDSKLPSREIRADVLDTDVKLRRVAANAGVSYFSLYKHFCPVHCMTYASNDVPLQYDESHVTREGAILVGRWIQSSGALKR
jgi:peptidoglycan/LPS O-acetylase OafA/YrhL